MMSRHFALNSELTGAIAKILPLAENQLVNFKIFLMCNDDVIAE